MYRLAGTKPSRRPWKMKRLNDEEIAKLTLPELIEALARIAEEIELRTMELVREIAEREE